MIGKRRFIILLLALSLCFPILSSAETVVLKSGKKMEGKIIERTGQYIRIDFYGTLLTYFLDEIESIDGKKISFPWDEFKNQRGALERELDVNKDGKTDHWFYSLNEGNVKKVVRDLDFDGIIDTVHWLCLRNKDDGKWEKMIFDNNNDGRIERSIYFGDNNQELRVEYDVNLDGKSDVVILKDGINLQRIEADLNFNGKVNMIQDFDKGEFIRGQIVSDAGTTEFEFKDRKSMHEWLLNNKPDYLKKLRFNGLRDFTEIGPQYTDNHTFGSTINDKDLLKLVALGNYGEAIEYMKSIINLDPQDIDMHILLGGIYCNIKSYDEAISEFNKALSISPDYPKAYCGLILVYSGKGKREEAMKYYNKTKESGAFINPDFLKNSEVKRVVGEDPLEKPFNYDEGLLKLGIQFEPPVGWRRDIFQGNKGIGFMNPTEKASILVATPTPSFNLFFQAFLTSFRNTNTILSEEKVEFLGGPCHIFITEETNKKGMIFKKKSYIFFKKDNIFYIYYLANKEDYGNYLVDFEESLKTLEVN